jgi:hypothetical protein
MSNVKAGPAGDFEYLATLKRQQNRGRPRAATDSPASRLIRAAGQWA